MTKPAEETKQAIPSPEDRVRAEIQKPKECDVCGTPLRKMSMGWHCTKCGTITSGFFPEKDESHER